MRIKIYNFLVSPIVVVLVILISVILTYFTGGLGYIFGIIIALTAFWGNRFKWSDFGISKPNWLRTILKACVLALGIFLIVDILLQPFIELTFGTIDLSALDGIRGNLVNYLIFLLFMWIVAAFGEEFLYRGFFMKRLAEILGNTNTTWIISAILISVLFGVAHLYQGISGVITTGLIGLFFSLIFYRNRENLILAMFTHGFYDVIGITLIYLNKERIITDWIQTYMI